MGFSQAPTVTAGGYTDAGPEASAFHTSARHCGVTLCISNTNTVYTPYLRRICAVMNGQQQGKYQSTRDTIGEQESGVKERIRGYFQRVQAQEVHFLTRRP